MLAGIKRIKMRGSTLYGVNNNLLFLINEYEPRINSHNVITSSSNRIVGSYVMGLDLENNTIRPGICWPDKNAPVVLIYI